jgi:formylglycine-generating enzyme required for sulfatase activity
MAAGELISFKTGADWISKLWRKLKGVRAKSREELEEINNVILGDPLELAKYYVEPDCQERNPADRDEEDPLVVKMPVMSQLNLFFSDSSKISGGYGGNQMFVLSDAGMGKTALLTMLKLMYLTSFWPQSKNCILKKLGEKTLRELEDIKERRETILLLDSLDEDPVAFGQVKKRLLEILDATKQFFRVIITCRTQFFPDVEEDSFERLGWVIIEGFNCPVKYLSYFTDDKVAAYLTKRFPKKYGILSNRKQLEEAQKVIKKMGSLRCRPMLLAYIEDLMTSPLIEKENSEYAVYNALIQSWLNREKVKNKIEVRDILNACMVLAMFMLAQGKRTTSEQDLDRLISKISIVKPVKHIDIKGRSLLNRNSEGDYRFSHYSIQEFLAGQYLLKDNPVFQPEQPVPLTNFMLKMVALSKKTPNFIEFLDFRGLNLHRTDLKGIQLPGANLEGLDLSGADFSGANLSGANLSKANLKGAVFKGVNIQGIIFSDAMLEGVKFEWSGMEFVYIPPGEFMRGSPSGERGRSDDEVRHNVTLTKGFFIQTTPVTQRQWKTVMGNNPSKFKVNSEECPVESVSWNDVQDFILKLNEQEGTDSFRLPTEAEWEYACRAGSDTAYCYGDDPVSLEEYAWYEKNSGRRTHPVAQKKPNVWGLYDMHGNVYEWCQDWLGEYPAEPVTNPQGPQTGSFRVLRGGSWYYFQGLARCAARYWDDPYVRDNNIGFRCARTITL